MWKDVLKQACKEQTQAQIATLIGYSPATVSLVLNGEYKGNEENVKDAVEKHLLKVTVDCPILGEITKLDCGGYRQRPFSSASRQSVELFKACKECEQAN